MSFYDGDVLDNTDEMECNNYVEFLFSTAVSISVCLLHHKTYPSQGVTLTEI